MSEEYKIKYDDFNHWFGLSYASYLVIPRIALQAMPLDWQKRMIDLIEEANEQHGLVTPEYHVLRDDPEYTIVKKYDEDDETSRDYEFISYFDDPWANYRRGDYTSLKNELIEDIDKKFFEISSK